MQGSGGMPLSIIIIAIIQFIQVPHMVWNADIMLEAGIVSRVHPILDWFLYGVDLIEIVSIVNVGMIMFSLLKKRHRQKKEISVKHNHQNQWDDSQLILFWNYNLKEIKREEAIPNSNQCSFFQSLHWFWIGSS